MNQNNNTTPQTELEKAIEEAPILVNYLQACGAEKLQWIVVALLTAAKQVQELMEQLNDYKAFIYALRNSHDLDVEEDQWKRLGLGDNTKYLQTQSREKDEIVEIALSVVGKYRSIMPTPESESLFKLAKQKGYGK